jgi:hypothetical protein
MSHSLQKVNVGNNALVVVKIIDYAVGGEAFTLAELGLTGSLVDVLFISNGVQGQVITPKLVGAKVQLGAPTGNSAWGEIPATTGINFVFAAIVQGTN